MIRLYVAERLEARGALDFFGAGIGNFPFQWELVDSDTNNKRVIQKPKNRVVCGETPVWTVLKHRRTKP